MLASASNALVVGFNVRPNAEARQLAEREGVEIRGYSVIYKLTEDIEQALVGMLTAVTTEETIGEAEVRATFKVSRLGTIAGCYVTNGVVRRNAMVRLVRDGTIVTTTTIAQLKRFKDDAREVETGFECGILLESYNDVKEGDVFEIFETREVERTSLDVRTHRRLRRLRRAEEATRPDVEPGYVGILSVELHFPEAHSLKEKRHFVRSAKAQLQNRFGASVAEVDHHDVWQRTRLTLACVTRELGELDRLLDGAERWLAGQEWELGPVHREIVVPRRARLDDRLGRAARRRRDDEDPADDAREALRVDPAREARAEQGARDRRSRADREQRPVDAARRVPDESRRADEHADGEVRPDRLRHRRPHAEQCRQPERAEDEPDEPAEEADPEPGRDQRPWARLARLRARVPTAGAEDRPRTRATSRRSRRAGAATEAARRRARRRPRRRRRVARARPRAASRSGPRARARRRLRPPRPPRPRCSRPLPRPARTPPGA